MTRGIGPTFKNACLLATTLGLCSALLMPANMEAASPPAAKKKASATRLQSPKPSTQEAKKSSQFIGPVIPPELREKVCKIEARSAEIFSWIKSVKISALPQRDGTLRSVYTKTARNGAEYDTGIDVDIGNLGTHLKGTIDMYQFNGPSLQERSLIGIQQDIGTVNNTAISIGPGIYHNSNPNALDDGTTFPMGIISLEFGK